MNIEDPTPTDSIPGPSLSEVEDTDVTRSQNDTERPDSTVTDKNPDAHDAEHSNPASNGSKQKQSPNFSSTAYILKFLAILIVANAALFAVCCWWYFERTRTEFIALTGQFKAPAAKQTEKTGSESSAALLFRLEDLQRQLAVVSKKSQASEEQFTQNSRRFAELAARISDLAKSATEIRPALVAENQAGDLQPSQSELVLLKERNRLSAYADEAIATGARGPYDRLWESLEDPRLAVLAHAVRSEILRVQNCFLSGQRAKYYGIQQHQIPVAEIFPESSALSPAQLSDDQLSRVLLNHDLDWQTRVKAAWHLGQRRTTKSAEALVKAIQDDPALDVVAEATFSFEQVTGYHARLFEVQPLLAWWSSYNKAPPNAAGPDPTK